MITAIIAATVELVSAIARAKGKPGLAAVVESTEPLATGTISAVQSFLASNPDAGITVEEFNAKIDAAKASALQAGDEAQARLDRDLGPVD